MYTQRPCAEEERPPASLRADKAPIDIKPSEWDKVAGSMSDLMEWKTSMGENPRVKKMQNSIPLIWEVSGVSGVMERK